MALRRSIRDLSPSEEQELIDGYLLLKHERVDADAVSTYDQYVVMHSHSMMQYSRYAADLGGTMIERFRQTLPPSEPNALFLTRRNAAHRGPAFLPWHREYIRQIEKDFQRVLGKPDFGLPYWDWEVDGDLPQADQSSTKVWQLLGGDGDLATGIVTAPPFGFDITDNSLLNDPAVFNDPKMWITVDNMGHQNGFLRRTLGRGTDAAGNPIAPTLPTTADVTNAVMNIPQYDDGNWDELSSDGGSFRCVLEGFAGPSGLHNRVHQWVGGSMGPGTSPNDPVFFLHHCNVDRIWAMWEDEHTNPYLPQSGGPIGHNWSDLMFPWNGRHSAMQVTVEEATRRDDFEYASPPFLGS
ncbi:MAG: tyrosinase family protein [Pseudomonadota bacterium]